MTPNVLINESIKSSWIRIGLMLLFACLVVSGCAESPPSVVRILEVSTLNYYGDLGAEVRCFNTADRPYFFTLCVEFTDDNGVVKEIQEPYLLIGGGETDTLGYKSSHSGVTKVRCKIKNCSPQ